MIFRFVLIFVAMLITWPTFADSDDGEGGGEKVADGFARCAAYYFLRFAGEEDGPKKEGYLNISKSNYNFSVVFSSELYAKNATLIERDKILKEISGVDGGAIHEYATNITVKCADLLVKYMEQLKDRGVLFR